MGLIDYKDIHSGERIFIIGNGPSLKKTPLSLLENEYSMAMNRIDALFESTEWRPTYYVQLNNPPYSNERIERIKKFNQLGITSFVGLGCRGQLTNGLKNKSICEYVNIDYIQNEKPVDYLNNRKYRTFWSDDICEKVFLWETSLYAASQIASFMGFDQIYFVGCDLYPVFKPVPYQLFERGADPTDYIRKPNNKQNLYEFFFKNGSTFLSFINGVWFKFIYRTALIDYLHRMCRFFNCVPKTHFDGGQPKDSRFYDIGTNQGLINIHKIIAAIGESKGFECYNATVGGQLEVHERVDIAEIV